MSQTLRRKNYDWFSEFFLIVGGTILFGINLYIIKIQTGINENPYFEPTRMKRES